MKLWPSLLVLVPVIVLLADSPTPAPDGKPSTKAKPLLLLDDDADSKPSGKTGADNSRCQVCHLNFAQEKWVIIHARAGIGCAKCHGVCDAHIADESWASGGNGTAPDIIYPRAKINPFCMTCHAREKITNDAHKDFFADASGKETCTDCHGKHRLVKRKCKWK